MADEIEIKEGQTWQSRDNRRANSAWQVISESDGKVTLKSCSSSTTRTLDCGLLRRRYYLIGGGAPQAADQPAEPEASAVAAAPASIEKVGKSWLAGLDEDDPPEAGPVDEHVETGARTNVDIDDGEEEDEEDEPEEVSFFDLVDAEVGITKADIECPGCHDTMKVKNHSWHGFLTLMAKFIERHAGCAKQGRLSFGREARPVKKINGEAVLEKPAPAPAPAAPPAPVEAPAEDPKPVGGEVVDAPVPAAVEQQQEQAA